MAAQYLKRLELASVDEEGFQTQYLKVVNVVDVLDQDGNPFPEPDTAPVHHFI